MDEHVRKSIEKFYPNLEVIKFTDYDDEYYAVATRDKKNPKSEFDNFYKVSKTKESAIPLDPLADIDKWSDTIRRFTSEQPASR